jgi:hypothetical protein
LALWPANPATVLRDPMPRGGDSAEVGVLGRITGGPEPGLAGLLSSSGKVQMQCGDSGKTTIASIRWGWRPS